MLNTVVVLFVAITSVLAGVPRTKVNHLFESRVVGGAAAPAGAYPHEVSLQRGGPFHQVGGAIIDHKWVVSSANFFIGQDPSNWVAYAGSTRLSVGGTSYKVRAIHIHENYNPDTLENNVAILEVQNIPYSDTIQPITVETEDVGGDEDVILAGWGQLTIGGFRPDHLVHISLKTTTIEECRSKIPSRPISDATICTSNAIRQGACLGDFGNPLIRTVDGQSRLVGIVEWFDCRREIPDVYARASSYRDWFNSICNCLN